MKHPIRWADAVPAIPVVKLQAVVRGGLVRSRLRLAGPGVLRRKDCVNDEEMVTFEEKSRLYPMDYFGWEENGKTWWMSIASMGQLMRGELHPANPYTKVPFSTEIRKRFRKLRCYCARYAVPVAHSPPPDVQTKLLYHHVTLYQTLEENGYEGIHPEEWAAMERLDVYTYLETLTRMLVGWSLEKPERPWRIGLANLARRLLRAAQIRITTIRYSAAYLTATSLIQDRQIPDLLFMIVSARFQALRR